VKLELEAKYYAGVMLKSLISMFKVRGSTETPQLFQTWDAGYECNLKKHKY